MLKIPALPNSFSTESYWGQLYGASFTLAISAAAQQHSGLILLITKNMAEATRVEQELSYFLKDTETHLLSLPDWETLPYDLFSPHQDIISQRLLTLYQLPTLHKGILVVPASTLMQQLSPREYIQQNVLLLNAGDKLDGDDFRRQLEAGGYRCVTQVSEHGEYAYRGSIIDLFPMGSATPYRLDLFDNEIESIREFDPSTQISAEKHQHIRLLPAREFPLSKEGITLFRNNYRDRFEGNPQASLVYREISDGIAFAGCEYYLPLFFEKTSSLFDYLPKDTLLILQDQHDVSMNDFWAQIEDRYEQRRHDIEHPILAPDVLYSTPTQIQDKIQNYHQIHIQSREIDISLEKKSNRYNFDSSPPPSLLIQPRQDEPSQTLKTFLEKTQGRILFVAESDGRREALLELLRGIISPPKILNSWQEFITGETPVAITVAPLQQGLYFKTDTKSTLTIITEAQIFGERALQTRKRRQRSTRDPESIIRNLTDLHIGSPVVHEENGVGRYLGLQTLTIGGTQTEFLALEYAGGDKLYVPVSSLHLINRYSGVSPEHAPLHRLGTDQWERTRRKAAQQVRDIAAELLDIHARRASRTGHAFKCSLQEMAAFASAFPFEETPDQQAAIDAVTEDMLIGRSMDRLICGDVGFGKTEVAMRAAFLAAQDGKQVAILVPTTLLAQQHYKNFSDRFADWPIRVESLSRFSTRKEQNETLKSLADGKIDIIIGTHKLIQKDVKFHNLGLLIIDEEHRFGVKHKEQLKSLRAEVDILTLTATPIPRTLNMAMSGLRELSIIATPPEHRTAIKTFINQWNDTLIQEACQRELKRGGQIYFVHNEVQTIIKMVETLQKIIPTARIQAAHGQLPERELEQIMLDFYHQRFNILVCTTIIESGIDIPTANTIIINRADKFGLAQLHQIRGRVGRSHHAAYAYLITPPENVMTPDAKKRLDAIESMEDLGAGFILASHDLEIRGAGELLGQEQSGQIHEVGYTLYTEMLERAVEALKKGEEPLLDKPMKKGTEIDLGLPALLPADYIYDVHTRLVLYKRIANAVDTSTLWEIQVELIDRFGLLPEPAKNLFLVTELKLKTTPIGINKIDINVAGGRIEFNDKPNIDVVKLLQLIRNKPLSYVFDGKNKLRFTHTMGGGQQRVEFIETLIGQLTT